MFYGSLFLRVYSALFDVRTPSKFCPSKNENDCRFARDRCFVGIRESVRCACDTRELFAQHHIGICVKVMSYRKRMIFFFLISFVCSLTSRFVTMICTWNTANWLPPAETTHKTHREEEDKEKHGEIKIWQKTTEGWQQRKQLIWIQPLRQTKKQHPDSDSWVLNPFSGSKNLRATRQREQK